MQHAFDLKISGPTQLRIMRLMWEYGYRTSTEICDHLEATYPIHVNTANTILNRLTDRGLLQRELGASDYQGHRFTPLLTKEEYAVLLFQTMASDIGIEWDGLLTSLCPVKSSQVGGLDINGPTELGMMLFIWNGEGCTRRELATASASWRSEPLTYESVTTTLTQLANKGLVYFEKARRGSQRSCVYLPVLTKEEYLHARYREVMDSLYLTPVAIQTPSYLDNLVAR